MNSLKELRLELDLSIRELSSYTGMNISTISHIENGINKYTMKHLEILSNFFSVDFDYLLNGNGHFILEDGTHVSREEYVRKKGKAELRDGTITRTIVATKAKVNTKLNKLIAILKTFDDETLELLTQLTHKMK